MVTTATALDMAFKPREPKDEFRLLVVQSLADDLRVIAKVRSLVNMKVGDKTQISVTEMLIEEAEALRDSEAASWGDIPALDDVEGQKKLADRLAKVYEADKSSKKTNKDAK